MRKKGELTTTEIVEIILSAGCILVLVWLLYSLIAPNFSRENEVAKSYFGFFNDAISIADKGDMGSFSVWQKETSAMYYIVYFGDKISFPYGGIKFDSIEENKNHVCVCYAKVGGSKTVCVSCENLNYPIRISDDTSNGFAKIIDNDGFKISKAKDENFYKLT